MSGRELVATKQFGQASTVLRDAGEEETAALFEELHRGVEAITERSARLLDSVCTDEGDYERARDAAIEVVAVARDEYADV